MQKLSVVIVCKNGAGVIGETIKSFAGLTDDVLVYDNGSIDGTQKIVRESGARLFEGDWNGFGKTKNRANALARYDWILSLDADEAIDDELKKNLLQLHLDDEVKLVEFRFKNFLGNKWLRFGEWGNDKHTRLFNRKQVQWNDAEVHESLIVPAGVKKITIGGYVLHKTATSIQEYRNKMIRYAGLNAEKYFKQGRKSSLFKIYFSPVFSFLFNFFFKFGFLDGATGFFCARVNAEYTFQKYKMLNQLNQQPAPDGYRDGSPQSEKTP